jgi:hypothetical protein
MNFRVGGLAAGLAFSIACASTGSQSSGTGAMSSTEPGERRQGSQASAGQDPIMQPGPQVKGHAEDQVITGQLGQVSPHSVSIQSSQGDTTTLELVPETSILVEGRDGTYADLQEGQPVRASYATVEGHDVAVEIHAGVGMGSASGQAGPGMSGHHGEPSSGSSGSSGQVGGSSTGSSGQHGEPSTIPPPLAPPDASPRPQ